MPPKNTVKEYKDNTFYHIYNRGVAKQNIFLDEKDFKTFLSYLKLYLVPKALQGSTLKVAPSRGLKNHSENIQLHAYCLMSNHYHLLIYQKDSDGINYFMRSLATKYAMYFNRRYKRVGPVFQGIYKAVEVESEEQFLYLSKYIHRNPLDILPTGINLEGYKYTSYLNYLRLFQQQWVKTDDILNSFNREGSYKSFVEETDESDIIRIKGLMLDFEE
jgi:REP element-mobilizing transposase RayT